MKKTMGTTQMPPTWYSVVINNPTPQDEVNINSAKTLGWMVEGQKEVGKNGTPHYQLAVGTYEPWKVVKGQFPRANIQEAEDPVALRRYVVKTETRALDFTLPAASKTRCPPKKLTNVEFFDGLLCTMWDMECTSEPKSVDQHRRNIAQDTSLTFYDKAVEHWMEDASTPQFAMELGTRANRPDVRAIYRRYRSAIAKLWVPHEESITLLTNADDDESLEQDAEGSVGEEHDDEEAEEEDSGSGTDDDTEGSSEATDQS